MAYHIPFMRHTNQETILVDEDICSKRIRTTYDYNNTQLVVIESFDKQNSLYFVRVLVNKKLCHSYELYNNNIVSEYRWNNNSFERIVFNKDVITRVSLNDFI